eukprot:15294294-Ditylum_brightwellii.AAC.1
MLHVSFLHLQWFGLLRQEVLGRHELMLFSQLGLALAKESNASAHALRDAVCVVQFQDSVMGGRNVKMSAGIWAIILRQIWLIGACTTKGEHSDGVDGEVDQCLAPVV